MLKSTDYNLTALEKTQLYSIIIFPDLL